MSVDEMTVDEITVDKIVPSNSVDKTSQYQMSSEKGSVDLYTDKMSIGVMTLDKLTSCLLFLLLRLLNVKATCRLK